MATLHIAARVRQIDELIARIAGYAAAIAARRVELAAYTGQSIWLDRDFAARADANLAATAAGDRGAASCARWRRDTRSSTLPRREVDTGQVPEPVTVSALPA